MRVLVTGGAGYIGSNLVDRLVREGHDVAVLDDLSTGSEQNLRGIRPKIEMVVGTILDEPTVRGMVKDAELVYHLAAAVGVMNIVRQPLQSIVTNARGTEIVLDACAASGTRVLVASTSEIYGKTTKMPMSEDDDRVLGSTTVSRWSYSTAKALDEHLALEHSRNGLPVSIVRYFNSYGPRIDDRGYGSVVANFFRQALAGEPITLHGDGSQTRCFTFVDDTVDGTVRAATMDAALGSVFNVGNDSEITVAELAALVKRVTGSNSDVVSVSYESRFGARFEDTKRRVPDLSRAASVLGYRPSVALEDGLRRTLEWWRQEHQ